MVVFTKLGPRAACLLTSDNWSVENEPGTNNWKLVIYETKIYGHAPLDQVVVRLVGYDGFRFGLFYNNRHLVSLAHVQLVCFCQVNAKLLIFASHFVSNLNRR